MIGEGLQAVALAASEDAVLAAGYLSGTIYFQRSEDKGRTLTTFTDGETRQAVGPGDPIRPAIVALASGEIMIGVVRDETIVDYLSKDRGEHWEQLPGVVR